LAAARVGADKAAAAEVTMSEGLATGEEAEAEKLGG
jgi:hypothetical protein